MYCYSLAAVGAQIKANVGTPRPAAVASTLQSEASSEVARDWLHRDGPLNRPLYSAHWWHCRAVSGSLQACLHLKRGFISLPVLQTC